MREVQLTRGMVALIDDEDWDLVSAYKWHTHTNHTMPKFYAATQTRVDGKETTIKLHRLLMNFPTGKEVDHINHDGLDCRRSNMRVVTHLQNSQNRAGAYRNSSTGVRGVCFEKRVGRFRASARVEYKTYYFGWHATLEAAKAAVEAGRRLVMTHSTECEKAERSA